MMKPSISFRLYTSEDFEFCDRLVRQNMVLYFSASGQVWDSARFQASFDSTYCEIICAEKGSPVGFYQVSLKEKSCYLHALHLLPQYRGRGIGTIALSRIHSFALQNNKSVVRLSVYQKNPAVALYEKRGYRRIEEKSRKWIMEKSL